MLNNIRNISDGFVVRLLLALIAFAFVGWGIKDVLQGRSNFDIVTFSSAPNITDNNFLQAKSEEITLIQRQNGINLSEEQIRQLGIDTVVLQKLINDRMLNYLASYYDFDLSEDAIIQFVKQVPNFKNEKGNFDVEIFKAAVKNSGTNEVGYLKDIKEKLLKNTLISIFLESCKTPKLMVDNIVNYMADTRKVELVQIALNNQKGVTGFTAPTPDELQKFYGEHQQLFTLPEVRNLIYLKIPSEYLLSKITVSNDELLNFYNENKEEFGNKVFDKVKAKIVTNIKQQKLEKELIEFSKNLEDSVAAGSRLQEIADRFGLKTQTIEGVNHSTIDSDKIGLKAIADNIFEMTEGEVSYPVELQDKSGLLLVEISFIKPSRVQEYETVREAVLTAWEAEQLKALNLKMIENLAKQYKSGGMSLANLSAKGFVVNTNFSITRSDIEDNSKLPPALLLAVFQVKIADSTPVFILNDTAYFANIKSANLDPVKAKEINKSVGNNIATTIRNGIIEELIAYLALKNDMKVNYYDSVLTKE